MLLPRYSLRWFFYVIVAVAMLGVIVGQGVQGHKWALAIALGFASLAATWSVMVLFYGIVSLYAAIALPKGERKGRVAYYPAPAVERPAAARGASAQEKMESV